MTSSESIAAGLWNGVERRADAGNPARVAIVFAREKPAPTVQNPGVHNDGHAPLEIVQYVPADFGNTP